MNRASLAPSLGALATLPTCIARHVLCYLDLASLITFFRLRSDGAFRPETSYLFTNYFFCVLLPHIAPRATNYEAPDDGGFNSYTFYRAVKMMTFLPSDIKSWTFPHWAYTRSYNALIRRLDMISSRDHVQMEIATDHYRSMIRRVANADYQRLTGRNQQTHRRRMQKIHNKIYHRLSPFVQRQRKEEAMKKERDNYLQKCRSAQRQRDFQIRRASFSIKFPF